MKNPKGCKQEIVDRAAQFVDSDDEIIFEEIKNQCLPKTSQFKSKASPEQYNKALNRYYDYVQKYLSDAEVAIQNGKVGMDASDEAKIQGGLGIAYGTAKNKCATPEFKDIEICKDVEKPKKLNDQMVSLDQKNIKYVAKASFDKQDADAIRTGKVINKVSKPKDWDWNWKLTQIVNGYAIFKNIDGGAEYVTAIKKSSIKKTLFPGSALSSSVDCIKYVSDKAWEDDKGFPIKAKIYEAASCPK